MAQELLEDNEDDEITLEVMYLKAIVILDRESDEDESKDIIYHTDIVDGDISATDIASYMAVLADNSVYHTTIKAMLDTRVGYYYDASIFRGLILDTGVNYALTAGI
jgi:hypothetical protein